MHQSSVWHMQDCIERHLKARPRGTVLELGSASRRPQCKQLFLDLGWQYVGADLSAGENVDIVFDDPFSWPVESGRFDALISGSMLEHNEMFWLSFIEMNRVLAPGGLMIHVAPSRGYEHWGPRDCWRFYPDGMKALAKWAGLECLEATTDWSAGQLREVEKRAPKRYVRAKGQTKFSQSVWGDTVGVFRKPEGRSRPEMALRYAEQIIAKWNPPGAARATG